MYNSLVTNLTERNPGSRYIEPTARKREDDEDDEISRIITGVYFPGARRRCRGNDRMLVTAAAQFRRSPSRPSYRGPESAKDHSWFCRLPPWPARSSRFQIWARVFLSAGRRESRLA